MAKHHGHSHGHAGEHGHNHDLAPEDGSRNERRLLFAAALTTCTMLAEVIGGVISGSLALLADAGHMLTDSAALILAWMAMRFARRPADWKRTFGFGRFEVLAAFSNGLALFFISAMIFYEALHRMYEPVEVLGMPMLIIAGIGLAVNAITFLVLHQGGGANLNVRAALLHVISDLLGSVAAILAAIIILYTGWTPIDPILSVVITLLIVRSAWLITKESGHILLQGAPDSIDVREVSQDLVANVPNVQSVHHVHAWSLSENRHVMTLHALTCASVPPEQISAAIRERLKQAFGVVHATIEIEHSDCADVVGAKSCAKV
ncbi:Cobalt-zinc-cadmium resistance protein CzcD [Hyphomicrobium sulfonivorans]|uniref:Cobalt-zinc-cadmium resistance protein CzcD n=1 Tax=Hyphomicrobium sulfonivorans TaxID=121290 RepID=A0A109BLE6_HYPSL|nr:cation diffusion facilitator family transporter [Hyphomicrobium sulfonivorans]KWT70943.1 Cobalt-zinc-cadmium resistance protein CzcD [Hyphomicrobium sulfonivorans]